MPLGSLILGLSGDANQDFFQRIGQTFDGKKLHTLAKIFAQHSKVQRAGKSDVVALHECFDVHFAGDDFARLLEWLAFSLKVNYERFFLTWIERLSKADPILSAS
jgi:hypothetical protein